MPFLTTVGENNQLLICNEENKKIVIDSQGNASIDDAGPILPPNDEIWYTSSDGKIVTPYRKSSLPEIDTNTYSDGKGVIKFKTDIISVGSWAFAYCSSLTSVTIPNSVTSIGACVFYACRGLVSATIPNSVISIG